MHSNWTPKDTKVEEISKEIQKILNRINETFERALEFCTYKDKR